MITAINELPDGTAQVIERDIDDQGQVVPDTEKKITILQKDDERPENEFAKLSADRKKESDELKEKLKERKISHPPDASLEDLRKLAKATDKPEEEESGEGQEEESEEDQQKKSEEENERIALESTLEERKISFPADAPLEDLRKLVKGSNAQG